MANWTELSELLTQLVAKYSGVIYDKELHERWDIGQAVCRGAYGKSWSKSLDYKKDNEADTPPVAAINVAQDWLENGLPKWAEAD